MAGDEHAASPPPPPRERPWLLPYNRKLRHLQGITIRNLTLTSAPSRPRGKTIDDDGLPSALKSPTKRLALKENTGLAHSRSSSDLKSTDGAAGLGNGDAVQPGSPRKPARPAASTGMRRRSTMEWSGASPLSRQKKLEDITGGRMADTFFSLHVEGQDDPIYISEVVNKAMNPNFRFFDLGSCGPSVTRLDKLTVKVWAKNENTKGWQYLVEFSAQLKSLQFIGKTMGRFKHPLPQNCILFHMTDGIYTSFTDLPARETSRSDILAPPKEHPDGRILHSSTYDALMRLSTLDDCIQDALASRDKLAEEIEHILKENVEGMSTVAEVPEAQERLRTVEAAVAAEKRRVDAAKRKRNELKANIQYRREKMQQGRDLQAQMAEDLIPERDKHKQTEKLVEQTREDITGQRRRVCEDLQTIFTIEPIPSGKSLAFTIRGLALPNGEFDDADEAVTAAALGYVAQVVSLLSPYLSVILPYPVTPNGSTSTIEDALSMNMSKTKTLQSQIFPLFSKGVVRYRFEYGVFLLNKNIEILAGSVGLRILERHHTLPNLKYLLFVATAGMGELPTRTVGGIKGLMRQNGTLSRKGSVDSNATSSSAGAPESKKLEAVGSGVRKVDSTKANGLPTFSKASFQKKTTGLPGSKLREVG